MAALHDALLEAVDELIEDRAELDIDVHDLQAWVVRNRGLRPAIGDVDLALRQLHRDGRLRLFAEEPSGQVNITPALRPRPRQAPTINVHGGHVQIGDHNQQSVTYGNILQSLSEVIEHAPEIAASDKRDLMEKLNAVASHPLLQTIVTTAVTLGTALGR